ncbi:MAG: GNAT family N-acetyltransferase [Candidatus Zixiibacteriota bacterium]|nr:MAG: GNAT family N-acetyltransferase [candidate division Zixibacteria bacterium]
MKLTMHTCRGDEDYWRCREFLREVFLLNDRHEKSWQVSRLDYWRWHGIENMGHGQLETDVFIWEANDAHIAAVLNREGPGSVFLQVHPAMQSPELEEEMITVAEKHLSIPSPPDRRRLHIWTDQHDRLRQSILTRRGYTKGHKPEYQRRRPMSVPIPDVPVASGYTIRPLGDVDEHPARSFVSWRAFHPDESDDQYQGWKWYSNIQRAPLYRRDLDIVAVAPGGELASFCSIWFDDVTRSGTFEPVGTAPEHQKRGLGKAVMLEGLRRLKRIGATMAYVGSYGDAAHALYDSVGFTEYDLSERWIKQLQVK